MQKVLSDAGVAIPLIGVVKDDRHRPVGIIGDPQAAKTYEKEALLADAEAHRFAISWHRKRRQEAGGLTKTKKGV
jgi:excinuclease UvrABC nuclease subunit